MKFPEHVTLSFLFAQFGVQQHYGWAGTVLVLAAGNLPDLDTLTLLGGWNFYRTYHRIVGHGLPVTLGGPALLAFLGSHVLELGPFLPLWCVLQLCLVAHLLVDVLFYRWPVQLLWPFSRRAWGFGLVSWNDLVPTLILYAASAAALIWQRQAAVVAVAGIGLLGLYLAWRAWWPRPRMGWSAWITGAWAYDAAPFWRWLTGDFIT